MARFATGGHELPDLTKDVGRPELSYEERQRALELTKYLAALSIVPQSDDMPSGAAQTLVSGARMPADTTLLALSQLGTWKLDCRRSFISLIDQKHQYLITEATRSVSLLDGNKHSDKDELWLGSTLLDLAFGVCPLAMSIFTGNDKSIDTPNIVANPSRYVVHDFTIDPLFNTRTYVSGWPHLKSYAEVPLISPSGFVIGSYCVVADELRHFDDHDITMLAEIAQTIMDHIDLLKNRMDHFRAERLVHGIGSFVTGSSSLAEHQGQSTFRYAEHARRRSTRPQLQPDSSASHTESMDESSLQSDVFSPNINSPSTLCTPFTSDLRLQKSEDSVEPSGRVQTIASTETESGTDSIDISVKTSAKDHSQPGRVTSRAATAVSHDIGVSLTRASNLIRQAMEMDGVVFVDASLAAKNDHYQNSPSGPGSKKVTTIGHSTSRDHTFDYSTSLYPALDLETTVMISLIENFPKGHLFSADANGILVSPAPGSWLPSPDTTSKAHGDTLSALFRALPHARSVMFLPIRDFEHDSHFAIVLAWSTDPARVLASSDLNFLTAFGNSVMADLKRLEAENTSNAKSDFISSISHELRSPLHGILATTESLREGKQTSATLGMLDTIDICGNLLMDTLTSMMEYAKINSFVAETDDAEERTLSSSNARKHTTTIVNLAQMVQTIVESLYIGMHADKDVIVLIDVDPAANIDVSIELDQWNRILTNLIGNALKYTTVGIVEVKLYLSDPPDLDNDNFGPVKLVHFQVRDSGRGMSATFLKQKLFSPFAQENNLSTGVGLGMSVAKSLIGELNGTIEVDSELGNWTTFNVTLPLLASTIPALSVDSTGSSSSATEDTAIDTKDKLRDLTLSLPAQIISANTDDSSSEVFSTLQEHDADLRALLKRLAQRWLNMKVYDMSPSEQERQDCDFMLRPTISQSGKQALEWTLVGKPTDTHGQASELRFKGPFGPRKLAAALLAIRNADSSHERVRENESFKITRKPQTTDTNVATSGMPGSARESIDPKCLRTLVVDDNPINVKLLRSAIEKAGHDVTVAINGLEAVEIVTNDQLGFHTIFMDLSMPVMDGFAATRKIRDLESAADSPKRRANIIALTALGSSSARRDAYAAGVDTFLCKPVKMKDIKALLKSASAGE